MNTNNQPQKSGTNALNLKHAGLIAASAIDLIESDAPELARKVLIGFLHDLERADPQAAPFRRAQPPSAEVGAAAPPPADGSGSITQS